MSMSMYVSVMVRVGGVVVVVMERGRFSCCYCVLLWWLLCFLSRKHCVVCLCVCVCIVHVYAYVYDCASVNMYVYMCVCVQVSGYVHAHVSASE